MATSWNPQPGQASEQILGSVCLPFREIENEAVTFQDTRKIFENGQVRNYTGALLEQQNQKLCYEYLRPKIVAKEPVSIGLVQEIHRILTKWTYIQGNNKRV